MFIYTKLDNYKVLETKYTDFYKLAFKFNYPVNNHPDLRQYFKWSDIKDKYYFYYEHFENEDLFKIFQNSKIYQENINFILRLRALEPIIEVGFRDIAEILQDISFYEMSCLGWEAISVCGKYIFEFTDEVDGLFISNFKVPKFRYTLTNKDFPNVNSENGNYISAYPRDDTSIDG